MNRLQFIMGLALISYFLTAYVLALVWSLKISQLFQIVIVFLAIRYPFIGFIVYMVQFIKDRRRKRKIKKERKKLREEQEKKKVKD